jgi:hypothetical protein
MGREIFLSSAENKSGEEIRNYIKKRCIACFMVIFWILIMCGVIHNLLALP